MKLLTDPRGTGFRFLRLAGTFFTYFGMLVVVLTLLGVLVSFFPGVRLPVVRLLPLVSLVYAVPLVVTGHLLHWLVAIWEAREKTNALLEELGGRSGG